MSEGGLSRTPPAEVRRQIRAEVGFGCPVPRCRSPFLEYHHFDPEWHVEQHHRPDGMIPLCPTHHAQAAAFTVEQLRLMKESAKSADPARGMFSWLRRDLVGVVGGNVFYETPVLVQLRTDPMVWFNRDEFGHALLNLRMLTTVGHENDRLRVEDNDFSIRGTPTDFECPPGGHLLRVRYENGDYLRIEFREVRSPATAGRAFPVVGERGMMYLDGEWPKTFVSVTMVVGESTVKFGPNMTRLPGNNTIRGSVMSRCAVGLQIG